MRAVSTTPPAPVITQRASSLAEHCNGLASVYVGEDIKDLLDLPLLGIGEQAARLRHSRVVKLRLSMSDTHPPHLPLPFLPLLPQEKYHALESAPHPR